MPWEEGLFLRFEIFGTCREITALKVSLDA
jgi:hypothetical protein